MQVVDASGNIFGAGLEVTGANGKPKVPVINTNITIGTTVIAGGVDGRILFQGTGGVVQESGNLAWDIVNSRITINTTTGGPAAIFKNATNGLTITPTSTKVSVYSDYFGSGTDKMLILGTYANQTNQLTLFTTGNVGVKTAIDAGFGFDVAGTIRSQGAISISNPLFTNGGTIAHTANSTLYITGGPGAGGENITFGPSNRIFINAGQTRFPSGSVQMSSTLTLGSSNATSTNMLLMQGSITAALSLGRGIGLDTTLVAAGNNDVLIGLDIQSAFTNGAFTGVQNYAARFGNDVTFTARNSSILVQSPTTLSNGFALTIKAGNAFTQGTGGSLYLLAGSGTGGPGSGQVVIGNDTSTYLNNVIRGYTTITSTGPNQGTAFAVFAGGNTGISIYWDNTSAFMQYGLVSGRQARFVNSTSYTFSSKVFINTTVDAGYNFDVNGTAIVRSVLEIQSTNGLRLRSSAVAASTSFRPNGNEAEIRTNDASVACMYFNQNGIVGFSQQVAFGSTTASSASAQVQIDSTTRGFLFPRMTTTQKVAIATPAAGLVVFDTTLNKLCVYTTAWETITSA